MHGSYSTGGSYTPDKFIFQVNYVNWPQYGTTISFYKEEKLINGVWIFDNGYINVYLEPTDFAGLDLSGVNDYYLIIKSNGGLYKSPNIPKLFPFNMYLQLPTNSSWNTLQFDDGDLFEGLNLNTSLDELVFSIYTN